MIRYSIVGQDGTTLITQELQEFEGIDCKNQAVKMKFKDLNYQHNLFDPEEEISIKEYKRKIVSLDTNEILILPSKGFPRRERVGEFVGG